MKELSVKAACTPRTIYYDFENRATWQPILQSAVNPEQILLKVINRYEQIYRQASIRFLSSSGDLAKLAALNLMLKSNSALHEAIVLPELMFRLKTLEDKAKQGVFVP